jgi:hypothetical protein
MLVRCHSTAAGDSHDPGRASRRGNVKVRATPLLLALGLGLVVGVASALAQKPPPAERPTYTVGERWVRNDGVYELLRIEGDRYVFAASADRQVHLSRDVMLAMLTAAETDGAVRQEVRTIVYEPPAVVAAATPPASTPPRRPPTTGGRW